MSSFKILFSNYKELKHGSVSMANEKLCHVAGLGDVSLNFYFGYVLTLKNVRHVHDLCHNLISCAALEDDCLHGKWGNGVMKILKESFGIFKAVKKKNLYVCYAEF